MVWDYWTALLVSVIRLFIVRFHSGHNHDVKVERSGASIYDLYRGVG